MFITAESTNSGLSFNPWRTNVKLFNDLFSYWVDSVQRSILFIDVLRQRGNNYLDLIAQGNPPVLKYDYEIVLDARKFEHGAVNYALVRIIPEAGVRIDPNMRPIVIIDPRAGHGPGIGGFKQESEIGVSLQKGHPVYFVIFFPEPIPGQTLADVERAEVKFLEEVARLHPDSEEPTVIGNCQGGWASMFIGADRPDVTGPIIVVGSPLSYWSGVEGANPMRYKGGLTGGVWLTSLLSDMGNGTFDGANLVAGFEDLNPANTYWSKQYNLYSKIDTEAERYLDFERWWGGFFYMTAEEIHFIVDNLFVGNKLEQGSLQLGKDHSIKLDNIKDPVVVFSSKGDNITPPQQALNWICKVYGSIEEIKRKQQILVYILHERIGHLGIFVSASVANREHREIVESLEEIEFLPPGLYEMIIEDDAKSGERNVRFDERTFADIMAMDDGFEDEENFEVVSNISDFNNRLYNTFIGPWVRAFSNEYSAEMLRWMHPMRVQRYMFSDLNPFMWPLRYFAPIARAERHEVSEDNEFLKLERAWAEAIEASLNLYREIKDKQTETIFKLVYENPWTMTFAKFMNLDEGHPNGERLPPKGEYGTEASVDAQAEAEAETMADTQRWLDAAEKGGFAEGAIRIMLALAGADRKLDRREFELVDKLGRTHHELKKTKLADLKLIAKEQSRILQVDKEKALAALPKLLTTKKARDEALVIAKTIVMADGEFSDEEKEMLDRIEELFGK